MKLKLSTKRRTLSENATGFLFISPWIIGFSALVLVPMIYSLVMSFHRWEFLHEPEFIGFKNYIKMFTFDDQALKSFGRTLYYTFITVPLQITIALGLAQLMNTRNIKGLPIYRAIIYLPSVISGAVLGILWGNIYHNDFGLFNYMLTAIGLPRIEWLTNPQVAMKSIILMSMWGIGVPFVMFLSALQNIPESYYEAADLDGISSFGKFRYITLPMITPVLLFVIIILLIQSFQILAPILVLTSGGPAKATWVFSYHEYLNAFQYMKMGYSSALSWFMFLFIMIITVFFMKSSKSWVYYETDRSAK